jgi:hypothetical protein
MLATVSVDVAGARFTALAQSNVPDGNRSSLRRMVRLTAYDCDAVIVLAHGPLASQREGEMRHLLPVLVLAVVVGSVTTWLLLDPSSKRD